MSKMELTDKQKEFSTNASDFLIVSAGPGAGKTETLVHYLDNLSIENKSKSILVSSFTNNSTNDIENRFKKISKSQNEELIIFKTFDSFLITKVWKYFFNRIIGFAWKKYCIEENDISKITLAKVSYSNLKWHDFKKNYRSTKWIENELAKFVSTAKKGFFSAGIFSEFILLEFIKDNNDIKKYLFSRYDRIVIDEAQDLSILRLNMLLELNKFGMKITLVGDNRQSIYSFLGSKSDAFEKLLSNEKYNINHIILNDNFRFKGIEKPENENIRLIFNANNKDELVQGILKATKNKDITYADNIVKVISQIAKDSILILTNSNENVKKINVTLEASNIKNDYREKWPDNLYKDMRDILFIENLYLYKKITDGKIKRSEITNDIVQNITDYIWPNDPEANNKFLKLFWHNILDYKSILIKLNKQLKIENMLKMYDSIVANPHLISQIPISRVQIMTTHGSKGLQADYIFFPQKIINEFLNGSTYYGFEYIYVALSRAKKKIILF